MYIYPYIYIYVQQQSFKTFLNGQQNEMFGLWFFHGWTLCILTQESYNKFLSNLVSPSRRY